MHKSGSNYHQEQPQTDGKTADQSQRRRLYDEDENPERGNWSGKMDFVLSTLGYAVGLGNVWRFPYLCYQNGGGAFLLPYLIMLLLLGIPCYLIELVLGQFTAMSPIVLYKNLAPALGGIGIAMILHSIISAVNYVMVISWSIYYLYLSLTAELPWQYCGQEYNSADCFSYNEYDTCERQNNGSWWIYSHGQCINNRSVAEQLGVNQTTPADQRVSATEEYLERSVLQLSSGIDQLGSLRPGLAVSAVIVWLFVLVSLCRGIKSAGKVVYFTAIFPYVVLAILLVRGVTLPGALEGIRYYMLPDFSRLADVRIWELAAIQVFFSLSVTGGGLMTMASYNRFNNNVIRDTLIVCIADSLTSFIAGFAIFSVLGFMAQELNVLVEDVATSGSGLAFVAYPELVTRLPVSPLWSVLFFAMCFTLGIDSLFGGVENIFSSVRDQFPRLRAHTTLVSVVGCTALAALSLVNATQGGRYVVDLVDYYLAGRPTLIFCSLELLSLYYVYGFDNFLRDLRTMTGYQPGSWAWAHLSVLYGTVAPLLVGTIMVLSWSNFRPYESGGYVYPLWANVTGCIVLGLCIVPVPLVAVYNIVFQQKGSPLQRLKNSMRATDEWFRHSREILTKQNEDRGRDDGEDNSAFDVTRL